MQRIESKVKVFKIGKEKTPVIVIDEFSTDIQGCVDVAIKQKFEEVSEQNTYYPGVRAIVDTDYGNTVLRTIADLIRSVYKIGHPNTLYPHVGYYSLVSYKENELELLQTLPHFDTVAPQYLLLCIT